MTTVDVSCSASRDSCCERLRGKMTPTGVVKKICKVVVVVLATAVALCICALPIAVYFIAKVNCYIENNKCILWKYHIFVWTGIKAFLIESEVFILYITNIYIININSQTNAHVNASYPPVPVNCTPIHGNYSASAELPFTLADCGSISWGMAYPDNMYNQGNCSAKPYTGIMCNKQLLAWQECTAAGSVQDVVLLDPSNSEQSEEERERDVAQFLHFLRELTPILSSWRAKFHG